MKLAVPSTRALAGFALSCLCLAASTSLSFAATPTPDPTMFPTYSYTAKTYDPSWNVRAAHNILHIDPKTGQKTSNQFGYGGMQTYFMSLLPVPIIISCFCLLILLLMFLLANCGPGTFWARRCWRYICCCFLCFKSPDDNVIVNSEEFERKKAEYNAKQVRALLL